MTLDRITVEAGKMNGQPCIRGYRLTVRRALEIAATYGSREAWQKDYPELEEEDVRQAMHFLASTAEDPETELELTGTTLKI